MGFDYGSATRPGASRPAASRSTRHAAATLAAALSAAALILVLLAPPAAPPPAGGSLKQVEAQTVEALSAEAKNVSQAAREAMAAGGTALLDQKVKAEHYANQKELQGRARTAGAQWAAAHPDAGFRENPLYNAEASVVSSRQATVGAPRAVENAHSENGQLDGGEETGDTISGGTTQKQAAPPAAGLLADVQHQDNGTDTAPTDHEINQIEDVARDTAEQVAEQVAGNVAADVATAVARGVAESAAGAVQAKECTHSCSGPCDSCSRCHEHCDDDTCHGMCEEVDGECHECSDCQTHCEGGGAPLETAPPAGINESAVAPSVAEAAPPATNGSAVAPPPAIGADNSTGSAIEEEQAAGDSGAVDDGLGEPPPGAYYPPYTPTPPTGSGPGESVATAATEGMLTAAAQIAHEAPPPTAMPHHSSKYAKNHRDAERQKKILDATSPEQPSAATTVVSASAATQGDAAGAASEWQEVKTKTGKSYFYNTVTRKTSWVRPAEDVSTPVAASAAASEWQEVKTKTGKSYFYNTVTRKTSWVRPAEDVSTPVAVVPAPQSTATVTDAKPAFVVAPEHVSAADAVAGKQAQAKAAQQQAKKAHAEALEKQRQSHMSGSPQQEPAATSQGAKLNLTAIETAIGMPPYQQNTTVAEAPSVTMVPVPAEQEENEPASSVANTPGGGGSDADLWYRVDTTGAPDTKEAETPAAGESTGAGTAEEQQEQPRKQQEHGGGKVAKAAANIGAHKKAETKSEKTVHTSVPKPKSATEVKEERLLKAAADAKADAKAAQHKKVEKVEKKVNSHKQGHKNPKSDLSATDAYLASIGQGADATKDEQSHEESTRGSTDTDAEGETVEDTGSTDAHTSTEATVDKHALRESAAADRYRKHHERHHEKSSEPKELHASKKHARDHGKEKHGHSADMAAASDHALRLDQDLVRALGHEEALAWAKSHM